MIMGLFDLLKKKSTEQPKQIITKLPQDYKRYINASRIPMAKINSSQNTSGENQAEYVIDDTIPESEKKYYQDDKTYTIYSNPNTVFALKVIPYGIRIKSAIPTKCGLYPPEIIMLYYCKSYPNPKNGYPYYWWFDYGIRNVGVMFLSLENRGFITIGKSGKYELTDKGKTELSENEYIVYTHQHIKRTDFTPWEANIMIGSNNPYGQSIIEEFINAEGISQKERYEESKQELRKSNPTLANSLDNQDKQLESILSADAKYKADKDIESYIAFWEEIWDNGGLLFDGMKWAFTLPDLYIKQKRYDDALSILDKLTKPMYADKVKAYREKIAQKQSK